MSLRDDLAAVSKGGKKKGEGKPSRKGFLKALEILDVPGSYIRSGAKELADIATGKDDASLVEFFQQAKDHKGVGDYLDEYGVDNRAVRLIGGLAGDIALDPLTYLAPQAALAKLGTSRGVAKALLTKADEAQALGKLLRNDELAALAGRLPGHADEVLKGGKGALSDEARQMLGVTGGLHFTRPGTGSIAQKLGLASEAKQWAVPFFGFDVTSAIGRTGVGGLRAAQATNVGRWVTEHIGTEGDINNVIRGITQDKDLTPSQALKAKDTVRVATGTASGFGRSQQSKLHELLLPFKTPEERNLLFHALDGDDAAEAALGRDLGELRAFLAEHRVAANKLAGTEFLRDLGADYVPHQLSDEARAARTVHQRNGGRTSPEFRRTDRRAVSAIEDDLMEQFGEDYVKLFEDDPVKVLTRYVDQTARRAGQLKALSDLKARGLVSARMAPTVVDRGTAPATVRNISKLLREMGVSNKEAKRIARVGADEERTISEVLPEIAGTLRDTSSKLNVEALMKNMAARDTSAFDDAAALSASTFDARNAEFAARRGANDLRQELQPALAVADELAPLDAAELASEKVLAKAGARRFAKDGSTAIDLERVLREQPFGFSFNPFTGRTAIAGDNANVVASWGRDMETKLDGTVEQLREFIAANSEALQDPRKFVGGYVNDDGKLVLDVSESHPDWQNAVRLGRERNQESIWRAMLEQGEGEGVVYTDARLRHLPLDGVRPGPALAGELRPDGVTPTPRVADDVRVGVAAHLPAAFRSRHESLVGEEQRLVEAIRDRFARAKDPSGPVAQLREFGLTRKANDLERELHWEARNLQRRLEKIRQWIPKLESWLARNPEAEVVEQLAVPSSAVDVRQSALENAQIIEQHEQELIVQLGGAIKAHQAEAIRMRKIGDKLFKLTERETNQTLRMVGRMAADAHVAEARALELGHQAVLAEKAIGRLQVTQLQDVLAGTLGAKGWKEIASSGAVAPGELAEWLTKMSTFSDPGEVAKLIRFHDKFVALWKAMAVSSPGFLFRNSFGAALNMYADGVKIENVRRFSKAWKNVRNGVQGGADEELVRQIAGVDLIGTGQAGFEVRRALAGERTVNPLSPNFGVYQSVRNANESVENLVRGAHAFDTLTKGGSIDDAIDTVFKYHFNYANVSDFEQRVVKRISPFWVFMSRNLPLQVELLISKPKVFKRYLDFQRSVESLSPEEGVVPGYFSNLGAIRLPTHFGGGQNYLAPDLPFLSASNQVDNITNPSEFVKDQISSFIPDVKVPLEIWAGKQFFKDIPFSGRYSKAPNAYLPFMPLLAAAGKAKRRDGGWFIRDTDAYMIEQGLPILGRMRRLAPNEERYQRRTVSTWLSFLFGIGMRTNTPQEQENEKLRRQDRVNRLQRDLKDLGGAA